MESPQNCVSGLATGRCSSIQFFAASFNGRSRNREPWFSSWKSGVLCETGAVNRASRVLNDFAVLAQFGILFLQVSEKAARLTAFWGKAKVGFCPYGRIPPLLEAGTVTFSLARLPERELNALS